MELVVTVDPFFIPSTAVLKFFRWAYVASNSKKAVGALRLAFSTKKNIPNSGPILRSLGAASRAEMLARKFKMNINSPATRQLLNSLDESVESFISIYRKSSIRSEIPGEFLE